MITSVWIVLGVISLFGLVWMYFWYPIVIWLLAQRRPEIDPPFPSIWPKVSLMIMTYNESKVIKKKIENSLTLDYPVDKLEILIVDSNSTDQTVTIAESFTDERVRIVQEGRRAGKASAINFGIQRANGDIIVVTDANAMIDQAALKLTVRHFSDPMIGAVAAAMEQRDISKTMASQQGGLYWQIEKFLRRSESRLASVISMSGEFSAYRKEIFLPSGHLVNWYPPGGTDDLEQSMYVVRNGYRIVYESRAVVWEPAPNTTADVAKQKIRIITQTIISVRHNLGLLRPKYGWYGLLIFPSRKIFPLLSPWLLILLALVSILLINSPFWALMAYVQILLYGIYLLAAWPPLRRIPGISLAHFFVQLNWLVLRSWFAFWRKRDFTIWDQVQSSRLPA